VDVFGSCNLDLDPMTFIMNLSRIAWRYTIYAHMVNKLHCGTLTNINKKHMEAYSQPINSDPFRAIVTELTFVGAGRVKLWIVIECRPDVFIRSHRV